MKKILLISLLMVSTAFAKWETDVEKAIEQSQKENKPLLVNFTGKAWCPYCVKLESEVFSKKEFKNYAKEELVLLELDFPRGKKAKKDALAMKSKYSDKIGGFPTVLMFNPQSKLVGKTGYTRSTAEKYVENLKRMTKVYPVAKKGAKTGSPKFKELVADKLVYADGTPYKEANLIGKNILLYFGGGFNAKCKSYTPELIKWYNQQKADPTITDNFEIIFISLDRTDEKTFAFMKEKRMPWPVLKRSAIEENKAARKNLKVKALPSMSILSGDKVIYASKTHAKVLERLIKVSK